MHRVVSFLVGYRIQVPQFSELQVVEQLWSDECQIVVMPFQPPQQIEIRVVIGSYQKSKRLNVILTRSLNSS